MIWSIPAIQDTTIYENDPYRNTGLDPVLELRKDGDSSTSDLTESRILMKFDLTNLNSILSANNVTINDITAELRLYPVQEYDLPKTYTIEARPIAIDWANGSGYLDYPAQRQNDNSITDGATWISTAGTGSATWSSSLAPNYAILFNSQSGGGIWVTSSIASQSFNFKSDTLVTMNVTNIVKNWINDVYDNNGFILSYRNADITASNYPTTKIQFYGCETTTVFEPQLYIAWTGSATYSTGSNAVAVLSDDPIPYIRSMNSEISKNTKVRINIAMRPRYPRPSFAQNSVYSLQKAFPINTYYQIKDAHDNRVIIPYSDFTKVVTTASGSYFDFYTTMMYGERFYKFEIKTVYSDFTEYYTSNDFIFKVSL
jgi:hypothetical protein